MQSIYSTEFFYDLLFVLFLVGFVVFVALYFVDAGYGKMRSDKWGPAMNNKAGWLLMEAPVFLVMLYLYFKSFKATSKIIQRSFDRGMSRFAHGCKRCQAKMS